MRGHDQIIAMRLRGVRPDTVSIHAGIDGSGAWRDWQSTTPNHAHVEIQADEPLSGMDLRFSVGMLAIVTGDDPFRVAAIHAGCLAAGAKRVISAAVQFAPGRPNDPGVVGRVLDSAEASE